MLLAKVQRKADTIAHQHARLDAHEVLRNLLTNSIEDDIENDDDDDVDALMLARHTQSTSQIRLSLFSWQLRRRQRIQGPVFRLF